MRHTVKELREKLYSLIYKMGEAPERYARNPGRDFTRRRALPLTTLIHLILTMDEKCVWKNMLGHFQKRPDTPSAAAFVQQRQKLLPMAFEELFHQFTDELKPGKRFRGYRLLAADGTSLKSASYPADADAYRPGTDRQHGWNLYHINALYDLENGVYVDALVQKEHTKNEAGALCEMAKRSSLSDPVILLADRGYETFNTFAALEQAGWKYLIRMKDKNRTTAYGLDLPDLSEFDIMLHTALGRLTERQLRQRGISVPEHYYRLPNAMKFDCLELGSADFHLFSARIVRLQLQDGSTETLVTNLPAEEFPPSLLRKLYLRRWGVETSFRQLKYTVGLVHLHSKKTDLILQEIFSSFIIFNFSQAVSWNVDTDWGHSRYKRTANFSDTVYLCCELLRRNTSMITELLRRKLQPHRPNRHYPRPVIMDNRISTMYISAR